MYLTAARKKKEGWEAGDGWTCNPIILGESAGVPRVVGEDDFELDMGTEDKKGTPMELHQRSPQLKGSADPHQMEV